MATSLAWMAGSSTLASRAHGDDSHRDTTLIQRENQHAGSTDWQLTRVRLDQSTFRSPWIEGYCSKQSVMAGESIDIMVSTDPALPFQIEIFRMGYYGDSASEWGTIGAGSNDILQLTPSAELDYTLVLGLRSS